MKELLYSIVKNGVPLFLASMYHKQFSLSTEIVALQIHWHDLAQYDEKLITCLYCAVEFEASSSVEEFTNCWSSKRNASIIYPAHYHNLQNKQIYWRGSWHVLVGTCKALLWAAWKLNLPWFGLKPTNTSSMFQHCIQVRKPTLSSKVYTFIFQQLQRVQCFIPQTSFSLINPSQLKTSLYILHTVFYTFSKVWARRICSTIKSIISWWSCSLFLWPLDVIQGWLKEQIRC